MFRVCHSPRDLACSAMLRMISEGHTVCDRPAQSTRERTGLTSTLSSERQIAAGSDLTFLVADKPLRQYYERVAISHRGQSDTICPCVGTRIGGPFRGACRQESSR